MSQSWVVGALDASWRAVYEILRTSYTDKLPKFKELWGSDEDWTDASVLRHVYCSLLAQGLSTFDRGSAGVHSEATV